MLNQYSIAQLSRLLATRQASAREVAQACLQQCHRLENNLHAFLALDEPAILTQADAIDKILAASDSTQLPPLAGIPIGLKDNIAAKDRLLSCASKILGKFISPYDATVTENLKKAGAILFGRLNLDEFAMGSSTENSAFGATRNPWQFDHVPGGSSGGCAAAVAADECLAALGSDTGGSIRQPAAFCGCVGLKPTYGRVSRYGLVAYASSLDQIGPLAKNVHDAAILLQVISGHDHRDSTSVSQPVPDYTAALNGDIKGLRIGLPKEYLVGGIDPEVMSAVQSAISQLAKLGADVVEISLPHTEFAIATYYIIATAEASANLARFDGIRYGARVDGPDPVGLYERTRGQGFGSEVKRRIILGTYVLSSGYYDAYYLRAQKVRTLIREDFLSAFEKIDMIVTPTTPTPAFKVGEKTDDPLQMYLSDIFNISCNLSGICGISVPCGFTAHSKLPIGLQLLGRPFGEEAILRAAHAYEQATEWHRIKPVFS
jgi:aspartyl-tRNA(Asn)/glutamyl-tRNA(Gln) amidotransferase subunit A